MPAFAPRCSVLCYLRYHISQSTIALAVHWCQQEDLTCESSGLYMSKEESIQAHAFLYPDRQDSGVFSVYTLGSSAFLAPACWAPLFDGIPPAAGEHRTLHIRKHVS